MNDLGTKQPVADGDTIACKTCSDYKHVCLGYTDSTAHLRSQSDLGSRAPPGPSITGARDSNQHNSRAVESCSPEPAPESSQSFKARPDNQPKSKPTEKSKDVSSSRETSARTHKDSESQEDGDTPESGKLEITLRMGLASVRVLTSLVA